INKCLTGKSSSYDSLRLSQAQILWGLYHTRDVDFAYLMWKDFVYQVEHKDTKKSNEMYYPWFMKVIIHHFMSKDPSIPRRNKFGALLPIELTNKDIRNSNAYKEYYGVATGATPPKLKASVWKTRSTKSSKAKSLSALSENSTDEEGNDDEGKDDDGDDDGDDGKEGHGDDDDEDEDGEEGHGDDDDEDEDGEEGHGDDDDEEDDGKEGNDDEDDEEEGSDDGQASDEEEFIHPSLSTHAKKETRDEESFDPIPKTPENTNDEGNVEENLGINVGREEGHDKEEEKMNYTETSILIKEGAYKRLKNLKTRM
nr:hypothetical protein [Tanacetum cinerariifolium]